jgi:hypothetical protein
MANRGWGTEEEAPFSPLKTKAKGQPKVSTKNEINHHRENAVPYKFERTLNALFDIVADAWVSLVFDLALMDLLYITRESYIVLKTRNPGNPVSRSGKAEFAISRELPQISATEKGLSEVTAAYP